MITPPANVKIDECREEAEGGHAVFEVPMTVQSLLSCPNLTRLNASMLSRSQIEDPAARRDQARLTDAGGF
jgi:hypothetical protein